VAWRLNILNKMSGATPPQLVRASASNQLEMMPSAYDKTQRQVSAKLSGTGRVAVLETPVDWSWVNYVIIGGLVLLALVGLVFLPLRTHKKRNYQEYLRAKYYNL
jgi:hypothetical protein